MALDEGTRTLLAATATATVTGELQRRGIRNAFLGGLAPLRAGQRMVGVARTLRFVPMREDKVEELQRGVNAQRRAVESLGEGDVLVMEARGESLAGTIGDVLTMRAERLGAVGVVTDGGVRDAAAVAQLGIAVYHRASHGATFAREHLPLDVDVPIACAGVLVYPGDIVVGDDDGAVVIPAALVDEVAVAAAEQELRDTWAFERVAAGESVTGVFPMSPDRRNEFEEWRTQRTGQ